MERTLILALISVVAIALLEAIGLNIVAKLTVIRDNLVWLLFRPGRSLRQAQRQVRHLLHRGA